MRIISKYKDYYDYLQGIYGADEKLILDRTAGIVMKNAPLNDSVCRFWICGFLVELLYKDRKFLYGEELKEMASNTKKQGRGIYSYYHKFDDADFYWYLDLPKIKGWTKVAKFPIPWNSIPKDRSRIFDDIKKEECPNDVLNCPILLEKHRSYIKFPMLSDYSFHRVFPPHEMWIKLTEWLGREKILENTQTNAEKILSNGFDLKTSFRHPIK